MRVRQRGRVGSTQADPPLQLPLAPGPADADRCCRDRRLPRSRPLAGSRTGSRRGASVRRHRMATPTAPPTEDVATGAVVAAQDVTRQYGHDDSAVRALRGVTMELPEGQFAAVMGPSGSGKSTLMHILAGL